MQADERTIISDPARFPVRTIQSPPPMQGRLVYPDSPPPPIGDAPTWLSNPTAEPPAADAFGDWPLVGGGRPRRPCRRLRSTMLVALAIMSVVSFVLALNLGGAGTVFAQIVSTAASLGKVTATSTMDPLANQLTPNASAVQGEVESAAQAALPSVVQITSMAGRQEAIGSGDILTNDGYIVTNDHVVHGFRTFTVTLANGTSQPAQLVGEAPQDDLAVLKITSAAALHPMAFADSSTLQVGAFVMAIGHPLALPETATLGIVSALNQSASEAPDGPAGTLTGLVQTTAPLNPGNSGGALVNLQGQLVGIPTLSVVNPQTNTPANGIGFAIPSNRVRAVANQLIQQGAATDGQGTANGQGATTSQGILGIQGMDVTARVAEANHLSVQRGVLITGFQADAAGQSPAKQAGVRTGDVVTAVDGHAIATISDLTNRLQGMTSGTTVTLTIQRGAAYGSVAVTLGAR